MKANNWQVSILKKRWKTKPGTRNVKANADIRAGRVETYEAKTKKNKTTKSQYLHKALKTDSSPNLSII
jgi:hypothetical protein